MVKKTRLDDFDTRLKGGIIAINLDEDDDAQLGARCTDGTQDIMLATQHGMAIRFAEEEVRPMGRTAAGVRGIELRDGRPGRRHGRWCEKDAGRCWSPRNAATASAPRSPSTALRRRGGIGIKTLQITAEERPAGRHAKSCDPEDDLLIITTGGQIIRQRIDDIRETGRSTQGVRLIRLDEGDHIASVARVLTSEEE